jgi:ABC-2 type transport system permease protein
MNEAPSQAKVLRRLYLTLFLRGRSARGLNMKHGTKSIAARLGLTLFFYALFGCMSLMFLGQSLFSLSIYLHGASLFFVGMFVASSSGEVLFNQQEAEILLHRPVSPSAMLWAKVSVLLQVSLWLSLAFNLAGMAGGTFGRTGSLMFAPAHAVSSVVSAMFCTGGVVLVYQLCLKWFGRERLDGLMTLAQIVMTLVLVMGSQIAPRMMEFLPGEIHLGAETWWLALLPPAWFAALDETLIGRGDPTMWALASIGIIVTAIVTALAFGKLAGAYESGLQTMGEASTRKPAKSGRVRALQRFVSLPPLNWWVRDPVERAGFQLVGAYMFRDRDVKLRLYPGLVPMMMMPVVMLANSMRSHGGDDFMMIIGGCYIPLIPMMALNFLRFSQHWQAADVFLITPTPGPGRLMMGARKAVEVFLVIPALLVMGFAIVWISGGFSGLTQLLPGILALPVYSRISGMGSSQLPLSLPGEEAKSAGRGLLFIGAMLSAMLLGGMAGMARHFGQLTVFLIAEAVIAILCAVLMDSRIRRLSWAPIEDASGSI